MSRLGRGPFWALLFLVFFLGQVAWGQNNSKQDSSASARERVHQLIVTRISNALGLDQAQSARLGEVLKKYKQEKQRLRYEIQGLTSQLRQVTNSGNEKSVQSTLKKLQETQDQLDRSDEVMFAEVKTMLTPNQVAQFVLIMDEIRHEVQAVKRRGRREYQGGPTYQFQPPKTEQTSPQPQLTNQPTYQPPYQPGTWNGYVTPLRPNSDKEVWVGN